MKLQEQINRIQSMMGVLSEDRTKKFEAFQTLINTTIDNMKYICENNNTEDDEYISFSACDLIDSSLKVKLIDFTRGDQLKLTIDITYKSYFPYLNEDEFLFELKDRLKILIPIGEIEVNRYENLFQH
jgi:hypothetical protein